MSVLVIESVKSTLLRGVFVLDTELTAVCKWTFYSTLLVVLGPHWNSLCTLLICWINSTEQLNREEIPVELISILNHLIASLHNSKSAYFFVKPVKEVWPNEKLSSLSRQQEMACLILFPVVWRWKSHLIINTVPVGAAVSSETDLFPPLMAVWEITGLEEMHSEAQARVLSSSFWYI